MSLAKRGIKDIAFNGRKLVKDIVSGTKSTVRQSLNLVPFEEEKAVRGFQFISQKPIMIILNSDEGNFQTIQI